jgi:hypothetical protein
MISDAATATLKFYGEQLQNAGNGTKGTILAQAMAELGWSKDKFYRNLKNIGFCSDRKIRKDAGTTSQNMTDLLRAASVSQNSARANGKILMETPNIISVLSQNGSNFLSASSVNRLRRDNNLTAKQVKQDTTHGHFKSLHPNHVHLADASLCVLYYPPGKKKGMKVQKYTTLEEQYKNKPEQLEKIKRLRVWRYVMVDHCSGLITFKYFECAGENQQALYDLLLFGWGKLSGSPFHGLPKYLYWDKGSAMTSKAIKHALACLNVDHIAHTTHLARATGAVEKANDIVEKLFEGRLFLESVNSVDELNQVAIKWQNAYNANAVPDYKSKHKRHEMARTDAWLTIMRAENIQHLRALPNLDYCRYIFTHEPVTRLVKGDLEITFVHPQVKKSLTYSLANLDGVFAKQTVLVSPLVVGDECKILVTIENKFGDDVLHEVAPLEFDQYGFRADSPVFGEGFDTKNDTIIDTNQKAMDRLAYPGLSDEDIDKAKKKKTMPFEGKIDALSHIANIDTPAAITPRGKEFTVPNEFVPETRKPLSPLDLKIAVTNALGRDLEGFEFDVLASYEAVYSEDIAAIVAELHSGLAKPTAKIVQFK